MTILIDTDVLLDVALNRAPHIRASAEVLPAFRSAAALAWKADFIVTWNLPDYRRSPVPALSPDAFLARAWAEASG